MPAKKTSEPTSPKPTPGGFLRWLIGPGRPWVLALLILGTLLAGWHFLWRRVGRDVLGSSRYQVTVSDIDVTPPPPWIHTEIRTQVFRDASLDGPMSVLDDALTDRIKNAFALHPWIAKVKAVEKRHPARVKVDVLYRRPVCMVEFGPDLIPVDKEGVVLPREDFTPVEAKTQYPRLTGIDIAPLGPVGTRWGNLRVVGGAEIAAMLAPSWQKLDLERIFPSAAGGSAREQEQTYELLTRRGTWIFWGRAPGVAVAGEPSGAEKLARLERYLAEHGTLEGRAGPQKLDLTRPGSMEINVQGAAADRKVRR